MYCHDLEVMSLNPARVEIGMVLSCIWTKNVYLLFHNMILFAPVLSAWQNTDCIGDDDEYTNTERLNHSIFDACTMISHWIKEDHIHLFHLCWILTADTGNPIIAIAYMRHICKEQPICIYDTWWDRHCVTSKLTISTCAVPVSLGDQKANLAWNKNTLWLAGVTIGYLTKCNISKWLPHK